MGHSVDQSVIPQSPFPPRDKTSVTSGNNYLKEDNPSLQSADAGDCQFTSKEVIEKRVLGLPSNESMQQFDGERQDVAT